MNIHFSLDFTTPFGVGDEVYTQWPPQASPVDSPAGPGCQKATIAAVKVLLDLPLGQGLVVSQPIQTQPLTIERVIYSLVPVPPSILSAFTVECPTGQDSNPVLFASEQELLAHYPDLVPC